MDAHVPLIHWVMVDMPNDYNNTIQKTIYQIKQNDIKDVFYDMTNLDTILPGSISSIITHL